MRIAPARPLACTIVALVALIAMVGTAALSPSEARAAEMVRKRKHDPKRSAWIRANFTKFEYRIPMRDGARLFTAVYLPNRRNKPLPIILMRTPYACGPYGADRYPHRLGPDAKFEKELFIYACQDVRGRFMSEGTFVNMRPQVAGRKPGQMRTSKAIDESSDTWDTIDWLVKNVPNNNGKVGMRGISYPGFYAAAGAINGHPALKAIVPQAPIANWWWDDMHHNGALFLQLSFGFFSGFGVPRPKPTTEWPKFFEFPTPDMYRYFLDMGPLSAVDKLYKGKVQFWRDVVAHPNYDAYWQSRDLVPHMKGIKAAVLIVGGWYDAEDLYGPLKLYGSIEKNNPKANNAIVMGPWSHGGWVRTKGDRLGDTLFGFSTSAYYQKNIELAFFKHHLKGGPDPKLPEALVFETGANRWRELDAWPPRKLKKRNWYLAQGGALSRTQPTHKDPVGDSWVSDPAKPVPYSMTFSTRMAKPYMAEDQRFSAYRPDVMVYRSAPLEEDVTFAGPIRVRLFVSTTRSAADFVVKLVDETPGRRRSKGQPDAKGGQQLMVRSDVMRGRFREGFDKAVPFKPNKPTEVSFDLLDVLHTFKRGHRIVVHVQSSWFPLVDRNPQKFVPNIYKAKKADFVKAIHTVYRSKLLASRLEVGEL